jgi:hypothetical protein
MNIDKHLEHSGKLIKKYRNIFGKYVFILDVGLETLPVVVGKGLFELTPIGSELKVGHIGKKLISIQPLEIPQDAKTWNRFIDEVCMRELSSLSTIQKAAAICFWYDAEMNSGGHSGFFDCYPNISKEAVINSMQIIGANAFVENFLEAVSVGKDDDYIKTDTVYYNLEPTLADILEKYVIEHSEEIL